MEILVARQPVFDDRERVVGFELLHGDGMNALRVASDSVAATSRLLSDHVLVEAGSQLTAGLPAWVPFPTTMLLDGSPLLVPANRLVVELDAWDVTDEVVAACAMLSDYGYTIAVGPVAPNAVEDRLLEVADVVRVDFRMAHGDAGRRIVDRLADRAQLLAAHVETRKDQAEALALGFELLQGDFLSQPASASHQDVDRARLPVLAAMNAVAGEPLDLAEVGRAVVGDAALTDRLLRHFNSIALGSSDRATAVGQALVVMGERDVRRWVAVNALVAIAQSSSRQLLVSALFRAHMCERLACLMPREASYFELFLTGMYSRVPLLVGADPQATIAEMTLPEPVRGALLEHHGQLWQALQLVIAWEAGDWDGVAVGCDELRIRPEELSDCYTRAVHFADTVAEAGLPPAAAVTSADR